jgi:hypothetical protein
MFQEIHNRRLAETPTHAAIIIRSPILDVGRVTPEKIVQKSVLGHFHRPRYFPDVIHIGKIRRKATVNAEYLLCNDGGERETVENICEGLPDFDVAASLAFVVESVDTSDVGTFVVTSEDEEVLWVFEFVAQ